MLFAILCFARASSDRTPIFAKRSLIARYNADLANNLGNLCEPRAGYAAEILRRAWYSRWVSNWADEDIELREHLPAENEI